MIRFIQALGAAWHIAMWLYRQKKQLDASAEEYLSAERAALCRLNLEKMFYALEHGNGNLTQVPKFVRWLFSHTKVDNQLGWFGLKLLKSEKLATQDKKLAEPIQPYQCH